MTKTNAEISLTTSFLAQELLNELFLRALAVAELVLIDAELINRQPPGLISKLSYHGTEIPMSRQALRDLRGRVLEFPRYERDARQRKHSLRSRD